MAPSKVTRWRLIGLIAMAACLEGSALPVLAAGLTPRGRENLVALARLTWLLQWCHPGMSAGRVDWSAQLVRAIPEVETAPDDSTLARALDALAALAGHPRVDIRPTEPPEVTVPPWLRQGPVVQVIDDVLYVALSPGDCCPTAISKIEDAMEGQHLARWILDLRHTTGRSFGSVYSEVKVTLDWMVEGLARTPPRCARASLGPCSGWLGRSAGWRRLPARTYQEGPGVLAGMPLSVVIDRTVHPAAAGWLLGLQASGLGELVGRPMNAQAQEPLVIPLSPSLEAALPLSRYVEFDGSDRRDPRVLPDRFVIIKPELAGAGLIARLDHAKTRYATATPVPPRAGRVDLSGARLRTRRIAAVIGAYCLARDRCGSDAQRLAWLERLLEAALNEADRASAGPD
ncbi:MAG: hypothetical protein ACE5GE_04800 [Phycisphaerae bacterium]